MSRQSPGLVCFADPSPWVGTRPYGHAPLTVLSAIRRAERRLAAAGVANTPLEPQRGEVPA